MPISEDEESDEYDFEHQVGNGGILCIPDDGSSSNSSSPRPSPSILKTTIRQSNLDGHSYHGERDIARNWGSTSQEEVPTPFYPAGYDKKALHEELVRHDRSPSCPQLAVASGASTAMYISSSSPQYRNASAASRYCSTLVFTARRRKNPCLFAFVLSFTLLGMFVYTQSYAALHNALDQVSILSQERSQVREHFLSVEKDIQRLQRELLDLHNGELQISSGSDASGDGGDNRTSSNSDSKQVHGEADLMLMQQKESVVDEMVALQEKLREGTSQVGSLQKHLQEVSKRDVIQKFGSGVIRVGLELEFPDTEKSKAGIGAPNTLVFEMAPLDLMPHSVYMFLEMVDSGLFDGCSFILSAMHVIKAAPLPYDGSSASQKVKAFTKLGLESVAFREYSPDFPNEQYTVGFAADGSPSFFINTDDNSSEHAGDPCFAKVVSGFDTVHRMQNAPTRNGIFFRKRIGIKAATIL